MRNKKVIKVLVVLAGTAILCLVIMLSVAAIYKDELVKYIFKTLNNSLITPLKIEKTSVSIFEDFPSISLNINNITLNDTLNNKSFEVIKIKKITFSFDLFALLNKEILIKRAFAEGIEVNHFIDKNGIIHSIRFKPKKNRNSEQLNISIPQFSFFNSKIHITNIYKEKEVIVLIEKGNAFLDFKNEKGIIKPKIKGKILLYKLNNIDILKKEQYDAQGIIRFFEAGRLIVFEDCIAKMAGLKWSFTGNIKKIPDTTGAFHDLKIKGIGNGVLFLKSLLPDDFKEDIFESGDGKTELNLSTKGLVTPAVKPITSLKLTVKNGLIKNKLRNTEFNNINLYLLIDNSDSTINRTVLKTSLNANFGKIDIQHLPSAYLNFGDKIISINASRKKRNKNKPPSNSSIEATILIKFNEVKYLNAIAKNVTTKVNLKDKVLELVDLKGDLFNGKINLNATFQNIKNKNIQCSIKGKFTNVDIPLAFFGFNNFNQKFIQNKNLKGVLNQEFKLNTILNEQKIPIMEYSNFIGKTEISKSELIQWEPIMKAFQFIGKEKVANLLIDACTIETVLYDKTVYFLPFQINSSFTKFDIAGNQGLNYTNELYLRFNLADQLLVNSKKKKINFKSGIDSNRKWGDVFVKLTGKESNYKPIILMKEDYQIGIKKGKDDYYRALNKVKELFR